MLLIIIGFLSSGLGTLFLVRYSHLHGHISNDVDFSGPQKIHSTPVPRAGGIAIFIGLVAAIVTQNIGSPTNHYVSWICLACSIPIFAIGLAEDLLKNQSAYMRLTIAFVCAFFAAFLLDSAITRTALPMVDLALSMPLIAIIFTCFAIAGLTHAYNIIDGFNGLASMIALTTLLAIAYIAFHEQDSEIMMMALALMGAVAGFFIWNYPKGLIFMGDGGAYLIGFWIALLSTLLVVRNPSVSPWFAVLVNAHPIVEALFTLWRRKFISKIHPLQADSAHFHSLLYRRLLEWAHIDDNQIEGAHYSEELAKAQTAPYTCLLSCCAIIPAVLWWNQTVKLELCFLAFCATYLFLYYTIELKN